MSDELIPACTCGVGGHDHSADCAVEVERRRIKAVEQDDLVRIVRDWMGRVAWSRSPSARAWYEEGPSTRQDFLADLDRRYALAERIAEGYRV